VLHRDLLLEEARYKRYLGNAIEVSGAFKNLNYAFYKFRKPVDHVSVDLDILISVDDAPKAARILRQLGFKAVAVEPYTVTLEKRNFIVDLYTQPSFAWIVYINGERLLGVC
jgi:adenylate cyclase class IV